MAMKSFVYKHLALATILGGVVFPIMAEDLDAALEAQKKKAQRQVYSERALLEERNLTVPQTQTEEERALDKKLREMEAKSDRQASSDAVSVMPRSAPAVYRPTEDKNWLTTAVMDDTAAVALTNETENAWLVRELERQKDLKEQESAAKENALVEKLFREKTQPQNSLPELDRLKQYQLAPQNIIGEKDKISSIPVYTPLQKEIPASPAVGRFAPKKGTPVEPPLFSPEAARKSAAQDSLLRSVKGPFNSGSTIRQPFSPSFSPDENVNKAVSPTPMEMIRKSSPINRPNPFSDDPMPQIKTSIWQ